MKKQFVVMLAAIMMAMPVAALATVANDEVTSVKIREATAGSTSQDTNSGNGIKTGHIVDTAVTTAKIANGAVTDAKISGTISTSKLNVGTSAGTVAAGNHNHDTVYQKKRAKVAVVAKSGGDYADPGTAMDNVSQWCGTPSAQNPCMVKIMPGVYDLAGLTIQPYVAVEGSGIDTTIINMSPTAVSNLSVTDSAMSKLTLNVGECNIYGSNATFNDIQFNGPASIVSAYMLIFRGDTAAFNRIFVNSPGGAAGLTIQGSNIRINDSKVKVTSSALALGTAGIDFSGTDNLNSYLYVDNSTIEVSDSMDSITSVGLSVSMGNAVVTNSRINLVRGGLNHAVFNHGNSVAIVSSQIKATGANYSNVGILYGNQTTVDNSQIVADDVALSGGLGGSIRVGSSKLSGTYILDAGGMPLDARCVNTYDGNYNPVTCQ